MAENERAEFETVLEAELKLLNEELRDETTKSGKTSVYERAYDSNLVGLAFSGGGIRSATFNLGVIQGLANYGVLSKFDYLSTVSGGGFIGGWLSALLHRKSVDKDKKVDQKFVEEVQQYLRPHPKEDKAHTFDKTIGFAPVEHKAVRYLLQQLYIPSVGLFRRCVGVDFHLSAQFHLNSTGLDQPAGEHSVAGTYSGDRIAVCLAGCPGIVSQRYLPISRGDIGVVCGCLVRGPDVR